MADRSSGSKATQSGSGGDAGTGGAQRLDKWLWYARVTKSRSLAAALVERGRVRVNKVRVQKPSHSIKPGDVITASVGKAVRVLKVILPGTRRGPAPEARLLYEELTPVNDAVGVGFQTKSAPGESGVVQPRLPELELSSGRPTKKERRQIMKIKGREN
ncbi:MAG: RNA-binding S4 domain-containing protein [Alphaproteobacteria bacterium]|nr:RNA-binding S4 domain-containing protein [Alphaproteobacteria bacterium]